ncbi:hypothetical protein P7C71_g3598, partial [Lecanoromycetidae sp. Uapishka_2]
MAEVILYDLPSKGHCAAWSYNPSTHQTFTARLVLNYKQIPYKTEWTEYPDIAPKLKSLRLSPNDDATPYTIPTICDTNGKYMMDSRKIASELEKQYPEPSLHLDSPILPKVQAVLAQAHAFLRGVVLPPIPTNLLRDPSAEYFLRTREARFGMPLSQVAREQGGEEAWKGAEPAFNKIGELLREQGGPFIMGKIVSYADFVIVSVLHFIKRIDEKIFERVVQIEPALKELYDASREWLKRDDY